MSAKNECRIANIKMYLAKRRLKQAIRQFPDTAEGATRLNKNCCVVSFSTIAGSRGFNLSPSYWMSQDTKDRLVKLVNTSRDLKKAIETILQTGCMKDGTELAPTILTALRNAWEG